MNHPVPVPADHASRPLTLLSQAVTLEVIAALSEGVRPWQQPWDDSAVRPVRPQRHTGEGYTGINVLLLWMTGQQRGYHSPLWMTYRQAVAYGGQVRRGAKGTLIVYADRYLKAVIDQESGEKIDALIPFLKTYTVFNSEQIDGLPERFAAPAPSALTPAQEGSRDATVEAFFARTGATIRHLPVGPYYHPGKDEICLPPLSAFATAPRYYATLAHELIHWTRHESRLNRDLGREKWGDAGYAREELVAELGAALLCTDLGLTPQIREDHAPYLGHWLQILAEDHKALFRAAAHAERAVAYLKQSATGQQAEHAPV